LGRDTDESDFKYESADAPEILLWFKHEPGGWRVGSDWQKRPSSRLFELEELRAVASAFVDRVRREIKAKLNIDVTPAFRLRR